MSYCKKKEVLFCNGCIIYGNFSEQQCNKFLTGFSAWKHIHQRIDEHESSQKHQACVEAYLQFSSIKTILNLLAVSQAFATQSSRHAKKENTRQTSFFCQNDRKTWNELPGNLKFRRSLLLFVSQMSLPIQFQLFFLAFLPFCPTHQVTHPPKILVTSCLNASG